jgi:hypothetical protein
LWRRRRIGQAAGQADGGLIRLHVDHTRRAHPQVLFDSLAVLRWQLVGEEVEENLD